MSNEMNHTGNELNTTFKKGGRIIIAGGGTWVKPVK